MPDAQPVIVSGRLAVHSDRSGRELGSDLGSGLLKDAVLRSIKAAELIGVSSLHCHAIDEEVKAFYLKHGFAESPLDPLTVLVGLRQASAIARCAPIHGLPATAALPMTDAWPAAMRRLCANRHQARGVGWRSVAYLYPGKLAARKPEFIVSLLAITETPIDTVPPCVESS